MKLNSLIIILILLAVGSGYVFGQYPIAGLKEEITQIETESLVLQGQVEELTESNINLIERLENISVNLTNTQNAFQALLDNYDDISKLLNSTQYNFQGLMADFEDLAVQFTEAQVNNSALLYLYSSLWEKYSDLIVAYNILDSAAEPIGEMVITEIPGVVNGDFESGGNEGWVKQGKGGAYAFGGAEGTEVRSSLWQYDHGTTLTQTVYIDSENQGLKFWVKPEPVGADVYFSLSLGGYMVFSQHYQGINSEFEWEKIVIPVKAIFELKEFYGLVTEGYYEIKFSVGAGEDNGAKVLVDQVSLVEISYQPEEPPTSIPQIEYVKNGGFEEPVQHDPWHIPEWGGGGTIGVYEGYLGKAVYLFQWSYRHRSEAIQIVNLDTSPMTLIFWIRPFPEGHSVGFEFLFDSAILFEGNFTGNNNEYDWEKITITLEPETGTHEIKFSVLTGPEYYPENMSHVAIDEISITVTN